MDKIDALEKRVNELEHLAFNLSKRCYALESELRHRDQKEYLENKIRLQ